MQSDAIVATAREALAASGLLVAEPFCLQWCALCILQGHCEAPVPCEGAGRAPMMWLRDSSSSARPDARHAPCAAPRPRSSGCCAAAASENGCGSAAASSTRGARGARGGACARMHVHPQRNTHDGQ